MFQFYTPWKHQKTRGFLMFPGGYKKRPWHENGLSTVHKIKRKSLENTCRWVIYISMSDGILKFNQSSLRIFDFTSWQDELSYKY